MPEENGQSPGPEQPVTHERPLPEQIGPYKVIAEIGRGGMGTVYRAHEVSLNRDVAIKVLARHLADDDTVVARFTREARSTAALSHPNVVHIYSTGTEQGLPYFAMEYVRGETLADLIRREKRLQPRRAAEILLQAASGLAAAHDHGIVHRDVKPANLMLDRSGHLKVTDFGIALAWDAGDKLTTTGQFVGTSGYISPEGCKGEPVDARSDIFSLGVVFYELLAGEAPFNDDSPLGMLVQVVEAKVPDVRQLNPDVDDDLLDILDRMIEKNPADRYQTCHELVRDMSDYLSRERYTSSAPGPGTSAATAQLDQLPASSRRRRWPAVMIAVVVMGLAGSAAGYYVWNEYLAEPDPRAIRATVDGNDVGSPTGTAAMAPEATLDPDGAAADEAIQQIPSEKTGDSSDNVLPRGAVSSLDEATSPTGGDSAREPGSDDGTGDTGSSVAGGPETATGPDGVEAGDSAESDPVGAKVPDEPVAGAAPTGERVASITPSRATPAMDGPPRVLVVADGDPVIAGPIEEMIREAVDPARFRLMEKAFLPGLERHIGVGGLDVPGLGDLVADQGGRILIVARIVPVGSTPLYYYGRTSTLYTSRIELESYDLVNRRRIGEGWSNEVRYTELNAEQQAEDAVMPLADRLAEALRGERFGDG